MPAENDLPEVRSRRRGDGHIVSTLLVVATAWALALWSGLLVGLLVAVLTGAALLSNWGDTGASEESPPRLPIPDGELVYRLRPGFAVVLLMTFSAAAGIGLLHIGTTKGIVGGVMFLLCASLLLVRSFNALVLRQQLRVTNDQLELPRSVWTGGTVTVPLSTMHRADVSREGSTLWLYIDREGIAFSRTWLGDHAVRELHAVLVHRIEQAKQK